jgi:hypothetical protein
MNDTKHTPTIIRNRYSRAEIPLPAPDIAVAFHDNDSMGLIPVSELNAPVTVDLIAWEAAIPGSSYQLWWDADEQGPVKTILQGEVPGDPLTLEIPVALLTEGIHRLAYRTQRPHSDAWDYSSVFPVIIDRTAPGKPQLAAIQFPVAVENGLTAAELERLGGKLDVEVAGYTGMTKHDVIQTYWGDIEGPTAVVDQNDMGLNKVVFNFSREFLEAIPDGPHLVKYNVTDRAGNTSSDSISVEILLLLENIPDDYPAPVLDPAVTPQIDYTEAKQGVAVDIPHYPGAAAFDQITLYWGDDLAMLPVQLPAGSEDQDVVLTLRVPFETVAVAPIGRVAISYRVSRQSQLNGSSLPTEVDVYVTLPIPDLSQAPVVQGTSLENPDTTDNFIDEDDYELNGRAIVAWQDTFRVNDDLNLFWGEQQRIQWHQISEEEVAAATSLIIPIANSIIKAQGTGIEIPVHYNVARQGNPNPATSPIQKVTVRSREELPGGADGIAGPTFEVNSHGYISQEQALNGAHGTIPPYVNIAENQKLFFTFKGFDEENNPIDAATFTDSRELDDVDIVKGYAFIVPYNILRTICAGFCEAYIRVEPAPGSNQSAVTSKVTRLPVEMRRSTELVCTL